MERNDYIIIGLFFLLIVTLILTLIQINNFMGILKTCDDDIQIINKCGCVPCTWKDQAKYNGNSSCLSWKLKI